MVGTSFSQILKFVGAILKKRRKPRSLSVQVRGKVVKTKLHVKRHTLSHRRHKHFRQRVDEDSESFLERDMLKAIQFYIPEMKSVQQYHFTPEKGWRLDFAFPDKQVAVEIQGYGVGHNSYDGMHGDYEKHNAALLLGWKILYFMSIDLEEKNLDKTISTIRKALGLNYGDKAKGSWSSDIETLRRRLAEKSNLL